MTNTGVLPVYTNSFAFGKNGRASADPADFVPVADMETFSISIDNGVEEWTPMDQEGWTRRLTTKKCPYRGCDRQGEGGKGRRDKTEGVSVQARRQAPGPGNRVHSIYPARMRTDGRGIRKKILERRPKITR